MSDQEKSRIQDLAAGFLGFVLVVAAGLGSLPILRRAGAAVKTPVPADARMDAVPVSPAPVRGAGPSLSAAPLGASGSAVSSRALLPRDKAREEGVVAAGSAGSSVAVENPAPTAVAKLVAGPPLDADAPAPVTVLLESEFNAKKPASNGLIKNQGRAAPPTVRYGVNSRAELMVRGAGPVYNLSGKKSGGAQRGRNAAADIPGQDTADVVLQVDAAQKQLDASDVAADEKIELGRQLSQVRMAVGPAPADQ